MAEKLDKSTPESKWKEILSAEDYYVLREKGTERAGKQLGPYRTDLQEDAIPTQ